MIQKFIFQITLGIVGVIILTAIITSIVYFAINKPLTNQQVELTNQEQQTQILNETANWQTYRNKEYGFEVKYPCDTECQKNPPEATKPNVYGDSSVMLPTKSVFSNVHVLTFSHESVERWNNILRTGGDEMHNAVDFPYTFEKLERVLAEVGVGQRCDIGVGTECSITLVDGRRAIRFIGGKFVDGLSVTHLINRLNQRWVEFYIVYLDTKDAYSTERATSEILQERLGAGEAVLNTFKFIEPSY